jgi:hypothetical protein
MRILALSAFHQDAAAALLVDGELDASPAKRASSTTRRAVPSASCGQA